MGDRLCSADLGELWKDIPGWEGYYQVSNRGRVWSVPRRDRRGRPVAGRLLRSTFHHSKGYLYVALCRDGAQYTRRVHQLVMLAFVGEPAEGEEVRHGPA